LCFSLNEKHGATQTCGSRETALGFNRAEALHEAAKAESCDFPGLGPHSFRRANITWRQEVGGSAIEASRIAGTVILR